MLNSHQKQQIRNLYEEGWEPERIAAEFDDNLHNAVLDYILAELA